MEYGTIRLMNTISSFSNFTDSVFLTIGPNLVSINLDTGEMTFGEDYQPTEAAQLFWSSILAEYREFLEWKQNK